MAYSTGDTILDDEYNTFVTGDAAGTGTHGVANVNSVWGTGENEKGYGQAGTLSAVTAGTTISAIGSSSRPPTTYSILSRSAWTGSQDGRLSTY